MKKYAIRILIFLFVTGFSMMLIGSSYSGPEVEIADHSISNSIFVLGLIFSIIPLLLIGVYYTVVIVSLIAIALFSIFPFLDKHPILQIITVIIAIILALLALLIGGEEHERVINWPFVR